MTASFQYSARDPLGKIIEGTLEASSPEDAAQTLRRDGFAVLRLEESDEFTFLPRRVRRSDIIYATSQLAIMVDTGVTLSTALEGIRDQEENPTLKKILTDLKSNVEAGEDFSSALAKHPKYFDKTFISMVKASEQTGTLGEMLERISSYLRNDLETRGKVRAAMAYPTVMLVLAIGVTIFLLTYVMPKFEPLFSRKGVNLPSVTVFMMNVSATMTEYWWAWIAGAVFLIVGFLVGRRTETGRMVIDWLKINSPIIGPMCRKVALSRSIRTLGTMVHSGVPMLDAVKLSAEVAGNFYYEKTWNHVLDQITQGKRIADGLSDNTLVPKTLIQMIGAGEETGRLGDVLQKVSSYYDREVEMSLKTTTSMIEPLMITAMGFVVGGIGLAIMLPIFSLSRHAG